MKYILIIGAILLTACKEELPSCVGDESESFESVPGIFLLTDTIPGARFGQNEKIIFMKGSHLPLVICNKYLVQINELPNDSIPIIFSGKVEVLPETVDAMTRNVFISELLIQGD